jgi:hypothetical protein
MEREDFFRFYNPGGEHRFVSHVELLSLLGDLATQANDWGRDFGNGEFAKLQRPFRPPDIGSVALQVPNSDERILS